MYRLFEFIRSTFVVILFIIAEMVAIGNYAWSSSYTRAKIFVLTNSVTGSLSGVMHNISHLLDLPEENRLLVERIAELESQIDLYADLADDSLVADQITYSNPKHSYIVGRVVSNSINKRDNYIVIDRGIDDGVYQNMAVITPSGQMLGYVAACSEHYSAALSIISHNFTTSGKIENGANYGSIKWEGADRHHLTMNNLSKYEIFEVGDNVVSTGFSQIFPGGVTIGKVKSFVLNEMETAYDLSIEIAAPLTAIDYVLLVGVRDAGEVNGLLESVGSKLEN